MLFDVPYIPEADYTEFLLSRQEHIFSLHFSLFQEGIADGRHKTASYSGQLLREKLALFQGVKKYALLNARFYRPPTYLQKEKIRNILTLLDTLLTAGNLTGIVFVDFYLLQALSDASREISSGLEAVPGVNCLLDRCEKIHSCLEVIEQSHFRLPGKINLDRSLNRDLHALEIVGRKCRAAWPGIRITLLANEGCLSLCPFKLSHDAHLAFAEAGPCGNETFAVNKAFGCIRILREKPAELFKSPFIRPEDVRHYAGYADVIKLCGRTLGTEFLSRAVTAYTAQMYAGNLLDLMDTLEWLAKSLYIDNAALPADFCRRLTRCARNCAACSFCADCLQKTGRTLPFRLPDNRPGGRA